MASPTCSNDLMAADPAPAEEQVPDPQSDRDGPKQPQNFLTFKDSLQVQV